VLSWLMIQEDTVYDQRSKASRGIRQVKHNIEKPHAEQAVRISPSNAHITLNTWRRKTSVVTIPIHLMPLRAIAWR
jgi:hypothetical protein